MSVLIKGMKMPSNCCACPLFKTNQSHQNFCKGFCTAFEKDDYEKLSKERMKWCPLVPIPPHGRLGDLDRLERMFADIDEAPYSGFDGEEPFYSADDAAQIIRLAPTIIPAEGGER